MSDPGPQRYTPNSLVRLKAQHAYICRHNGEVMLERMEKDKKFMLGRMLRSVRRESGETLLSVSEQLDMSVSDASKIETGDTSQLTLNMMTQWLSTCRASAQLKMFKELFIAQQVN